MVSETNFDSVNTIEASDCETLARNSGSLSCNEALFGAPDSVPWWKAKVETLSNHSFGAFKFDFVDLVIVLVPYLNRPVSAPQ